MTINLATEVPIAIGEGSRAFPPRGVSGSTMARWIQKGIWVKALDDYVKLETILIGGRRFTSLEAIARFIAAQNTDETPAFNITLSQRRRQSETAKAALEKIGIKCLKPVSIDDDLRREAPRYGGQRE
jgi:hypothetical protein